jgi:hypothetical protein
MAFAVAVQQQSVSPEFLPFGKGGYQELPFGRRISRFIIPAKAQGCPGKFRKPIFAEVSTKFYINTPLARACPGHPRLEIVANLEGKTWVPTDQVRGLKAHGPSPATGILFGCTGPHSDNRIPFPGQPCAKAGIHGFPLLVAASRVAGEEQMLRAFSAGLVARSVAPIVSVGRTRGRSRLPDFCGAHSSFRGDCEHAISSSPG